MTCIRDATAQDVPLILQFIRELADYEKLADQVVATPEGLLRDGFSAQPYFHVVLAEWEAQPAGFALYFYNYSTFRGRPVLYLEDIFVRPSYRGKGIGKALLRHLAGIAVQKGCGRLQWQVLDWNAPAIRFYESLGAEIISEWQTMRITGGALERLAAQAEE